MVVTYKLDQYGVRSLLRKLDPKRVTRARDRALNRGSAHLARVIKAESRVKTGRYKGDWITRKHGESHTVVNVDSGGYADLVTGITMPTRLRGGRRRGAGAAFMKKIRRENSMVIRHIMQEVVRELVTN